MNTKLYDILYDVCPDKIAFISTSKWLRDRYKHKYIIMNRLQLEFMQLYKARRNIIITGPAGSGKSYCIKRISNNKTAMLAVTGSAAYLIGGRTIHSFIKNIKEFKGDTIIIDECGMLNDKLFAKLYNAVHRRTGGRTIQYILSGDFLQLPPVKPHSIIYSNYIELLGFKFVYLNIIHRQSENTFIRLLDKIRFGTLDNDTISILRTLNRPPLPNAILLRYSNREVDNINSTMLSMLDGASIQYETTITFKLKCRCDKILKIHSNTTLKVGARVMLLINVDTRLGLVNGAIGEVISFDMKDGDSNLLRKTFAKKTEAMPVIKFKSGTYMVGYTKKEHKHKSGNTKIAASTIIYMPLKLAYSITIHKAQGLTLDAVNIYMSGHCNGLFYTAISRARTLDGISLYKFNPSCVSVDKDIVTQLAAVLRGKGNFITSKHELPNTFAICDNVRARILQLRDMGYRLAEVRRIIAEEGYPTHEVNKIYSLPTA